jgi:hypothetical protein
LFAIKFAQVFTETPVAVKTTGEPPRPVAVADTVFAPAAVASVSVVCACPFALVSTEEGEVLPFPLATNTTVNP